MDKLRSAICFLLAMLCVAAPASANAPWCKSTVGFKNETTDAYVWVTAYERESFGVMTIRGSWCVAPGAVDTHTLSARLYEVRVEVRHATCGSHQPVRLDATRGYPECVSESDNKRSLTYWVRKNNNGSYSFGN